MSKAQEILNLTSEAEVQEKDNDQLRRHYSKMISDQKAKIQALRDKLGKAIQKRDDAPNDQFDKLDKPVQAMWKEMEQLRAKLDQLVKDKKKALKSEAVRPSQAADDAEDEHLIKLAKEQHGHLQDIAKLLAQAAKAADDYNKWLDQNEVEALLFSQNEKTAKAIHANLDHIKGIV